YLPTALSCSYSPPLPLHDALPILEPARAAQRMGDLLCLFGGLRESRDIGRATAAFRERHVQLRQRLLSVAREKRQWRAQYPATRDRKSTRLNSSHLGISYAVFCLK